MNAWKLFFAFFVLLFVAYPSLQSQEEGRIGSGEEKPLPKRVGEEYDPMANLPKPDPKFPVKFVQTPNDAVHLVLADVKAVLASGKLTEYDLPFIRYRWDRRGEMESARTFSVVMNTNSRGSSIYRPIIAAEGHLSRIDLRLYAPQEEENNDLKEILKLWEEFRFDPNFSLLITEDELDFAKETGLKFPTKKVPKTTTRTRKKHVRAKDDEERVIDHSGGDFVYPDGSGRVTKNVAPGQYKVTLKWPEKDITEEYKELEEVEVPVGFSDDVQIIRFDNQALDLEAFQELKHLLHTEAPIVEDRYLKSRLRTTVQDDGIYKTIFGGLYYEFVGIKTAEQVLGKEEAKKVTDQQVFFEKFLGIGSIKGKVDAKKLFNQLRSDQRAAKFRSDVTGKPRVDLEFPTLGEGHGGAGRGHITIDIRDQDVDLRSRSFANLIDPIAKAQEGIFKKANSFEVYILFNGAGALQREVPPDIAPDTTIPNPHTKRLQPCKSCQDCHQTEGSDGWKDIENDIRKLVDGRLDIFGELATKRRSRSPDTFDRLAGLYAGQFGKSLRRARDDLAESTLIATGTWLEGDKEEQDPTKIVKTVAKRLQQEYREYNYDLVDAHEALEELGLLVPKEQAVKYFAALVPPDIRNEDHGFIPEDPRCAAIRQGLAINRTDWSLVYGFVAERARPNIEKFRKEISK